VFKYESFEPSHFVAFLKQGLFDEEINRVLSRFNAYVPQVQYELIKYIKLKSLPHLSIKVLGEALEVSQEDARRLVLNPCKEFKVIVTENCRAKLVRGLVIPGISKVITNNDCIKRYLNTIYRWYGEGFAVFFDAHFRSCSFMLPLAVALCVKSIPEDVIFTGKIDERGNLLEIDDLEIKCKFAREINCRLITPLHFSNVAHIKSFLERQKWDIPFYITCGELKELDAFWEATPLKQIYKGLRFFEALELFYNLKKEDFCIITGQLEEMKHWKQQCVRFCKKVCDIKNTIFGEKLFHFGINGPATLAFSLGILWGSQEPFYIYHYQSGKYHQISVSDPRELKERVKHRKLIEFEFYPGGRDLAVFLQLAHHEILLDAKSYIEHKLNSPSYLLISHITSENVGIFEFKEIVREIASLIQDIRREYTFNNFHFFFSCPVPIAFMLGVAFGHYADGVVYNYQKQDHVYIPVMELKFLRKLREDKDQVEESYAYGMEN